jgi:hypothetical protein
MYTAQREGAKDPHGSFAHLHAALVLQHLDVLLLSVVLLIRCDLLEFRVSSSSYISTFNGRHQRRILSLGSSQLRLQVRFSCSWRRAVQRAKQARQCEKRNRTKSTMSITSTSTKNNNTNKTPSPPDSNARTIHPDSLTSHSDVVLGPPRPCAHLVHLRRKAQIHVLVLDPRLPLLRPHPLHRRRAFRHNTMPGGQSSWR